MYQNTREARNLNGTFFWLLATYKYTNDRCRSGVWEPQDKFVNGTGKKKSKAALFKFKSKIHVLKFNTCGQMAL